MKKIVRAVKRLFYGGLKRLNKNVALFNKDAPNYFLLKSDLRPILLQSRDTEQDTFVTLVEFLQQGHFKLHIALVALRTSP